MGVCAHPLLCVLCQVSECHPGMAGLLCARALCLGRPYTARVWRALRMGAAGSQTCAGGGGGGVMRQFGMNETHEEAAH